MTMTATSHQLDNGETLDVFQLEVPCGDWGPRLTDFMYLEHPEYTNCSWHLNCKRVMAGDLLPTSRDVFFAGLLGDRVVGTCWYATPRLTGDLATFGRVVTSPAHRRKGISTVLCAAAVDHFRNAGGWCMHLGTDLNNPARFIYERLGFVHYNFEEGRGTIMRNVLRGDPETWEAEYYEPGWAVTVRPLAWGDLAGAEALLNLPHWFVKDTSLGVYANTPFEGQFFDLMSGLEARRTHGWALVTEEGRLVGLAYLGRPRAGAGAQDHLRVLEFVVHPAYAEAAAGLLSHCVPQGLGLRLAAYASALDVMRCEVLEEAGFVKEATLEGWLQDEESEFDLYVYGYPG